MIEAIWRYIMEKRYERSMRLQRGEIANYGLALWGHRMELAGRFKVYSLGNGVL